MIERSSTIVLYPCKGQTLAAGLGWASLAPTLIVYNRLPMALICPICKSQALELVRTGDATGFYCPIHGHFKVADTISVDDYYTRAEWETALRAAKYKAMEGEWPVIRPGDFFR